MISEDENVVVRIQRLTALLAGLALIAILAGPALGGEMRVIGGRVAYISSSVVEIQHGAGGVELTRALITRESLFVEGGRQISPTSVHRNMPVQVEIDEDGRLMSLKPLIVVLE